MRGLMIDCSRLIEQHGYYHELIDQIADWGYDTLVLHFCDDHGLTVVLSGFEDLAAPHALTLEEIKALLEHGLRRHVRVIPELECFGHARWLDCHPRWGECFVGDRSDDQILFNSVDPTNPLTEELMDGLIGAVCRIFPDEIVHIGCDEVDLNDFCRRRGIGDPLELWSGWVNRLIGMVHARGRRAMLWADHVEQNEQIALCLDKRAILVSWHYGPDDDSRSDGMRRLQAAGFTEVVSAPAIQCWTTRLHAMQRNLVNVDKMERHARTVGAMGTLDTIWCPFRHIQQALWHGIASSAHIHRTGTLPDDDGAIIAEMLFGGGNAAARRLCRELPLLECDNEIFKHLYDGTPAGSLVLSNARNIVRMGSALCAAAEDAHVCSHPERLEGMRLSARCAVHLARRLIDPSVIDVHEFRREHAQLIVQLQQDWDCTRFADDPARQQPRWGRNWGWHYLLPLMLRFDR